MLTSLKSLLRLVHSDVKSFTFATNMATATRKLTEIYGVADTNRR